MYPNYVPTFAQDTAAHTSAVVREVGSDETRRPLRSLLRLSARG